LSIFYHQSELTLIDKAYILLLDSSIKYRFRGPYSGDREGRRVVRNYTFAALGLFAGLFILVGALLSPLLEEKAVTVHTKSRTFEGTLVGNTLHAVLSFDGKKEPYFVREGGEHKYLISPKEDGYCFQIQGSTLLQMPGASSVCKRNN
jgi:hypothetical protein